MLVNALLPSALLHPLRVGGADESFSGNSKTSPIRVAVSHLSSSALFFFNQLGVKHSEVFFFFFLITWKF